MYGERKKMKEIERRKRSREKTVKSRNQDEMRKKYQKIRKISYK